MLDSNPVEFLKGTLRNPAAVGSIIPSSKYLAREYLRNFELDSESVVLELGPGTGPVTKLFYEEMPDPSLYLGVEQDADYVRVLKERFPEMNFVAGSAEDAIDYLDEAGLEGVDLIASALPYATLPDSVQQGIYEAIDELMTPGTVFRTIQLAHAWPMASARRFRARMNRRYGELTRSRLVWRNVPPAFVMTWRA